MKQIQLIPLLLIAACAAQKQQEEPQNTLSYLDQVVLPDIGFLPVVFQAEGAVEDMKLTWGLDPQFEAALLLIKEGNYRSASIQLNGLRSLFPESESLFGLHIFALIQAGDTEAAEKEAAHQPLLSTTCGSFSWALVLQKLGRHREALPRFLSCIEKVGEESSILWLAAESALASGHPARAIELLDKMVPEQGQSQKWELMRAEALQASGRNQEAYRSFRHLAEAEETNSQLWNEAGMSAFRAAAESSWIDGFEFAAECFSFAGRENPQEPRYAFNLGCALDWDSDFTGAEEAYLRALELNPVHMKAAGNLVELWTEQSRWLDARRLLEKMQAQSISPGDYEWVRQTIFKIDETMSRVKSINGS